MSDLQVTITLLVFAGVILAIAFNVIDMAVAALLGVSVMLLFGVFTRQEFLNAAQTAGGLHRPAVRRHGRGAHPGADRDF